MKREAKNKEIEEYRQHVRHLANVVLERWQFNEQIDRPKGEILDEIIDSSQYVIYYNKMLKVLQHCDNELNNVPDFSWKDRETPWKAIQGIAFECLKRDVERELEQIIKEKDLAV